MKRRSIITMVGILIAVLAVSCSDNSKTDAIPTQAAPIDDPHSFSNPHQVGVAHLELDLTVDFEQEKIIGQASLRLENKAESNQLVLDSYDLTIQQITVDEGAPATFSLGKKEKFLGQPLTVDITPTTEWVHILYETSPDAPALQWLNGNQTVNGKPYLYTQSQAILARSWIPCQDTPGERFTYRALIRTRPDLLALMSAENSIRKSRQGFYEFEMPQPIPSYLMALAVGEIDYRSLSPISGVYANPALIDAAAYEFGNTQQMIDAAEKLYGPYRWEKYDILVLPPAFPFGGMENPRLTFVTPTIIAGDRSLTSLIAHELAHSWSGNLVTNATWNDFWLNEGFTTYIERRIMEEVYDTTYAEMLWELGFQDLMEEVGKLGENHPDTRLHLDLAGRDPDEGMSDVAYEKGAFFLRMLEEYFGREEWDMFLREYFDEFAFQSMTSEGFMEYLKKNLLDGSDDKIAELAIEEWIFAPGLPDNCPEVHSQEFEKVEAQLTEWGKGAHARNLDTAHWTTHHWLHFLRSLPDSLTQRQMAELDVAFGFTESKNSEILFEWLMQAIQHRYTRAYPALERFLAAIGRRKFLDPLYRKLAETEQGRAFALQIYENTRDKYHPITYRTIDRVLDWERYVAQREAAQLDTTRESM